MTGQMIVELILLFTIFINVIPPSPSVGGDLSPLQIVTGIIINYINHCRLQFVEYAQVHESHDSTMQERSTGEIALSPTSNSQGEYLFMSLATGMILNHQSFTLLPLSQDIINSLHRFVYRNPRGLDIRYIYRRPFLEADYRANNDTNSPTYALSSKETVMRAMNMIMTRTKILTLPLTKKWNMVPQE